MGGAAVTTGAQEVTRGRGGGQAIVAERRGERLLRILIPASRTGNALFSSLSRPSTLMSDRSFHLQLLGHQDSPGNARRPGSPVPQRVWVRSIAAEQEVGGPQVTDRPPFGHCGGKSEEGVSQQGPWGLHHPAHPFALASYPRIASGSR